MNMYISHLRCCGRPSTHVVHSSLIPEPLSASAMLWPETTQLWGILDPVLYDLEDDAGKRGHLRRSHAILISKSLKW